MPQYAYEALTATGAVARGSTTAASEQELEEQLRAAGSYLIRAEPRAVAAPAAPKRTDGSIERRELLAFTEYLSGAVQAGIPILGTLSDVELRLTSKKLKRVVAEVRRSMEEDGRSLSEALAEHPKAFSELYTGTVEAGEASGQLDFALRQLVAYLDWQQEITTQLRQATMYPAFVVTAVLALVLVLIAFVYPKLIPVLTSFDVELPLPTRVLMATALFLQTKWWLLVVGAGAAGVLLWLIKRTPAGALFLHGALLKLPIFGGLILQINMARFVTYTALFYRTGVELIRGLILVERMMANRVIAAAVGRARVAIVGGESMASAFGRSGLFPPIVVRSIALGESTGGLDEALGRAKGYYDREVPAAVRRMLTALQPLLVIMLGGVILAVALSIIMPILSIYNSIGR